MTCPSQSSRLNHSILAEQYKLWSSSLWSPLHSPFSSLLGPNIRLRILFSNPSQNLINTLIKNVFVTVRNFYESQINLKWMSEDFIPTESTLWPNYTSTFGLSADASPASQRRFVFICWHSFVFVPTQHNGWQLLKHLAPQLLIVSAWFIVLAVLASSKMVIQKILADNVTQIQRFTTARCLISTKTKRVWK